MEHLAFEFGEVNSYPDTAFTLSYSPLRDDIIVKVYHLQEL